GGYQPVLFKAGSHLESEEQFLRSSQCVAIHAIWDRSKRGESEFRSKRRVSKFRAADSRSIRRRTTHDRHREQSVQRVPLPVCPPRIALWILPTAGRTERCRQYHRLCILWPGAIFDRRPHRKALPVDRQPHLDEGKTYL